MSTASRRWDGWRLKRLRPPGVHVKCCRACSGSHVRIPSQGPWKEHKRERTHVSSWQPGATPRLRGPTGSAPRRVFQTTSRRALHDAARRRRPHPTMDGAQTGANETKPGARRPGQFPPSRGRSWRPRDVFWRRPPIGRLPAWAAQKGAAPVLAPLPRSPSPCLDAWMRCESVTRAGLLAAGFVRHVTVKNGSRRGTHSVVADADGGNDT